MVEEIIKKGESNDKLVLKYDREKYSIEYIQNRKIIILRRLLDNQVLDIFSDNIGFIIQCNKFGQVHFLVSVYVIDNVSGIGKPKFKHFIDKPHLDSLYLEAEFNCESIFLDLVQISDGYYLVKDLSFFYVYNLKHRSKGFANVYNDPEVNKFFDKNTMLVSEMVYVRYDLVDYLTYGINLEDFTIVTPIWSEFQKRFIEIYTHKQVTELREKMMENGIFLNLQDLGEITIYFEVERYMQTLARIFQSPKQVYIDDHQVNEEFIRKFVKK